MTAFMGWLARRHIPRRLRRPLWAWVGKRLGVDPQMVPGDLQDYPTFLAFFTRPLPPGQRPLPDRPCWLAPADGRLVAISRICPEGSWVIKGTPYSTPELLPTADWQQYLDYYCLQIYLSPRDYHRFHAPCAMKVLRAVVEPGDLQPVDPALVRRSMRVLVTNRRILLHCEDAQGTPFALLFVGALNVGGMSFPFDHTLGQQPWVRTTHRYDPPPKLEAGEELGQFEFGSTIVLFAPPSLTPLLNLDQATQVRAPFLGFASGPETTRPVDHD